MQSAVILKTKSQHLPAVLEQKKHAVNGRLQRLLRGDVILIAESPPPCDKPQIRYAMRYSGTYRDTRNETDEIWGSHWPWIVEGEGLVNLDVPFSIREVQISHSNYQQGGTIVYLHPLDIKEILKKSLLRPLL